MVALRNHYGAPLSRKRLYIFLIREDVMTAEYLGAIFRDKLTVLLRAFADMEMVEWFLDWLNSSLMICIKLHLHVLSNPGESPAQHKRPGKTCFYQQRTVPLFMTKRHDLKLGSETLASYLVATQGSHHICLVLGILYK